MYITSVHTNEHHFCAYLGRCFSYSADASLAKEHLTTALLETLTFVRALPITPLLKCHPLNLQIRTKHAFTLSHDTICPTWLKLTLDSMVTGRVRRWLVLPLSATAHFLPLPHKMLGLDIILPSMLSELCQLGTDMTLLHSKDTAMKTLHSLNRVSVLTPFGNLAKFTSRKAAIALAKGVQTGKQLEKLENLQLQLVILKSLRAALPQSELVSWSSHISTVSPVISNLARKALIQCLPTNANLHRWYRSCSGSCPSSGEQETENHVLNNCCPFAVQGRYTWCHNAVLRLITSHLQLHLSTSDVLYVDLPDQRSPSELYTDILPDVTVVRGTQAYILELTCYYEKNFEAIRMYKVEKYRNPSLSNKVELSFDVHTVEVSSLSFVATSCMRKFLRSLGVPAMQAPEVRCLEEMALRCSFYIFAAATSPGPGTSWTHTITESSPLCSPLSSK